MSTDDADTMMGLLYLSGWLAIRLLNYLPLYLVFGGLINICLGYLTYRRN